MPTFGQKRNILFAILVSLLAVTVYRVGFQVPVPIDPTFLN